MSSQMRLFAMRYGCLCLVISLGLSLASAAVALDVPWQSLPPLEQTGESALQAGADSEGVAVYIAACLPSQSGALERESSVRAQVFARHGSSSAIRAPPLTTSH